ncbi:hypothetical protein H4219_004059 [Mycoemilia scoparia]|uniref:Conserved oligomeric Golgi complex subunit 5 n=1 Tax=Mycoemilia scoparia TaxID=417184 RepID=A0A9W7ZXA2_9FUNG|nr:hypothetical protein H4219_004059 [Mycoemilia scoparia]
MLSSTSSVPETAATMMTHKIPPIFNPTEEDNKFEAENADFLGIASAPAVAKTTPNTNKPNDDKVNAKQQHLGRHKDMKTDSSLDLTAMVPAADDDPSGVTQMVSILNKRIQDLDDLMKSQVLKQHSILLRQVTGLRKLDSGLQHLENQISKLKEGILSLQTKLRIPYEQVILYDTQIKNLYSAIQLVRSITKYMQLAKRLSHQIPDTASTSKSPQLKPDPNKTNSNKKGTSGGSVTKTGPLPSAAATTSNIDYILAALTLRDINQLTTQYSLQSGIDIIEKIQPEILEKQTRTENEAKRLLDQGISRGNQTDIANSLQIIYNLGQLSTKISKYITEKIQKQETMICQLLDPNNIQSFVQQHNAKAVKIDGSDMTGITAVFWNRLDAILSSISENGMEINLIERVLRRKKIIMATNTTNTISSIGGNGTKTTLKLSDYCYYIHGLYNR